MGSGFGRWLCRGRGEGDKGQSPGPHPHPSPQRGPSPTGPARATEGRRGPSGSAERPRVPRAPWCVNILDCGRGLGRTLVPLPVQCSSPPRGWGGAQAGPLSCSAFSMARPAGLPSSPSCCHLPHLSCRRPSPPPPPPPPQLP